jgi:hypothetical protein
VATPLSAEMPAPVRMKMFRMSRMAPLYRMREMWEMAWRDLAADEDVADAPRLAHEAGMARRAGL